MSFITKGRKCFFLAQETFNSHVLQCGCHVSLFSFNNNPSIFFFFFLEGGGTFVILIYLKSTDWLFCKNSLQFGFIYCFLTMRCRHFEQEDHRSDRLFVHRIRKNVVLICRITGCNFDHLVRVLSARFPPHRITIFPFVMVNISWENPSSLYKYPAFHQTFTQWF